MLQELRGLGGYLKQDEGWGDRYAYTDTFRFEKWMQATEETDSSPKIISIVFKKDGDEHRFSDVVTYDLAGREFDIRYKSGTPRGGDWSPTSVIQKYKSDTAVRRIFKYWFGKQEVDDSRVKDIHKEYSEKEETIQEQVKDAYDYLDDKSYVVLTVQLDEGDGPKFIDEYDLFKDRLKERVEESWHHTSSFGESSSEGDVCSVCGRTEEVFGFSFPFAFYTVDNKRYTPDFDRSQSWRNVPVCRDCAYDINLGRYFLRRQQFSFYTGDSGSIDYYVLPSFPLGNPTDEIMDRFFDTRTATEQSFIAAEDFYTDMGPDYPVSLAFIFYETAQSSETIRRYVEDVAPSHIKEAENILRDVKKRVYEKYEDHDRKKPNSNKIQEIIFTVLPGAPTEDESPESERAFMDEALDITAHILKDESLRYRRLINMFGKEAFDRMQRQMAKGESSDGWTYYPQYTVRTFMFLNFLDELGLLIGRGETTMDDYEQLMERWNNEPDETLEQFFDDFDVAFDTPDKRAMFLLGVLSKHLMNAQYQMADGGNPPFEKKLANLRLTRDKVENFYTTLFQDIDHYDAKSDYNIGYPRLRQSASTYLMEADQNGWSIENDELRYYFTLGMSVNDIFKSHGETNDD